MADPIKVELTADEWGQVMMVLQSGIYRVVAPLLQKINGQLVIELQRNQMVATNVANAVGAGPRLVDPGEPTEAAE